MPVLLIFPPESSVRVSAKHFADYTQDVSVSEDMLTRISVCFCPDENRKSGAPGVDASWRCVNGDKLVDEQDKQAMLQILHVGEYREEKDVNQDQKVDLVDMQYVVQSMGENQLSTVETLRLPKEGLVVSGTEISGGNLENLFQDSGKVQLKTASNQQISEENPVGLEFFSGR